MSAATIARLKITLDDVKPVVLRRIEVPLVIRLDRLHLTLQAAMGWSNSHLYELRAGDVGWGIPDPDWNDGPLDARKTRLGEMLQDVGTKTLRYIYDFGDDWEHTIKVERVIDPVPGVAYPRLIDAAGRCPPEDIGGPWGYLELLDARANPKHERHAECEELFPEGFDPEIADVKRIADELDALAKQWSRKSPVKRTRRT
jgi:Plasmid pRiA4b ORF-3-like protein